MIFRRRKGYLPKYPYTLSCGIVLLIVIFETLFVSSLIPNHRNVLMPAIENELEDNPPEGYYAFVESPKMEPPQVKLPPYIRLKKPCQNIMINRISTPSTGKRPLNNLCGDLNKGVIPMNPMNQNIYGTPYPFELIKNKTLEFFSKTLPILKADQTIPKVATMETEPQYYLHHQPTNGNSPLSHREKREIVSNVTEMDGEKVDISKSLENTTTSIRRQSRKFCDNDRGLMCIIYKLIQSQIFKSLVAQKRQDPPHLEYRTNSESTQVPMVEGPPTPCPAKVEYATPVFARNYQGIWRYIVQIPYEGYFTQTIEVTKCINTKCYYMDGGCLSSPRWISLLVAEIFYPDTIVPSNRNPITINDPPPINEFQYHHRPHQYLHKRAVSSNVDTKMSNAKKSHCDGVDDVGCFQIRLYYDWFLVPGSCKCWRPDYFSKYVKWNRESSYEL